jgi:uncharacterized cupin superfamily protein
VEVEMNQVEFEAALKQDGFDDTGVMAKPEMPINDPHAHVFDARALVLDGEITLTIDGVATAYRVGDMYDVPAGTAHQETVPRGGVQYVYGLRHRS